jgi:phage shock protein A
MFEQLRASFRAMLDAARSPDDRRAVLADMKDSVVRARMGVDDLRQGVQLAQRRLDEGRAELETIRRRRALAANVGDQETVSVADRFEALQAERVSVLERKLEAQQAELALVEREVAEMTTDLRRAMDGVPLRAPGETSPRAAEAAAAAQVDDLLDPDAGLRGEFDALGRRESRTSREADAEARLAELKRRLGK